MHPKSATIGSVSRDKLQLLFHLIVKISQIIAALIFKVIIAIAVQRRIYNFSFSITMRSIHLFLCCIVFSTVSAQFTQEKITFESANPFSLSDIIHHLDEQEKQTVYGQLTLPVDSLNPQKSTRLFLG